MDNPRLGTDEKPRDPRIEQFLITIRAEMSGLSGPAAINERVHEVQLHLEQSIEEFVELGVADPVAAALEAFGTVDTYGDSVKKAGDGILLRDSHQQVLKWVTALVLIPICADLAMDFSSWFTSDSQLFLLGIPFCAYVLGRILVASTHSRKFLFIPITGIVAMGFVWFIVLGGFSRGALGDSMTEPRGTASRSVSSLQLFSLSNQLLQAKGLREGYSVFRSDHPTAGVGEFRVAQGYLTPEQVDSKYRTGWYSTVSIGASMVPVSNYSEARLGWMKMGPKAIQWADEAVASTRRQIEEQSRVANSSWLSSVQADLPFKIPSGIFVWFSIITIHALGMGYGVVRRRSGRRPTAAA